MHRSFLSLWVDVFTHATISATATSAVPEGEGDTVGDGDGLGEGETVGDGVSDGLGEGETPGSYSASEHDPNAVQP
jgi:hypothetical protein